uniref:B box-type domain-containing protein n=2 Tax=Caenorhabditis japonica TaxID=281687 RepID=A0A8R1DJD7_CAEJA
MALTASNGCPPLDQNTSGPPVEGRRQTDLDAESRDSNDSGNELSMGGSSSEGDSMSHHQSEHSPNQHDSLLGPVPQTNAEMMNLHSPSFKTLSGSLFDTPPSILQSPHQQFHAFSPSGFGFCPTSLSQDLFVCAVCTRNSHLGLLQFVCAHKTCQSCCQKTPLNYEQRMACNICGAGPATAANFPPQMFLSPTIQTPPHGGLVLDTSNRTVNSTPQHPARAFSFSLGGNLGSPSPALPRMSTPASTGHVMRPFPPAGFSDLDLSSAQVWSPMQHPQSQIKGMPNLNNPQSPMVQNVFDSLAVNDEAPVFSPLSPTNTSMIMPPSLMASSDPPKHSATIAPPRPLSVSQIPRHFQLPSPTTPSPPFSVPPPQFPTTPIQCQGCDSNVSFAFCMQCQEALCTHCVQAHQRVRATKAHSFVELNQLVANLIQMSRTQAQAQQYFKNGGSNRQTLGSAESGDGHTSGMDNDSMSGDSPRSSSGCRTHDSPIVGICDHCAQATPLCAICIAEHPNKHRVHPLGDIRKAVGELAHESEILQWQCKKTGETIKRIIEGIVANANTAENEIRTSFETHINALEERKKELLKRVEVVKNLKLSVLFSQAENLKSKQNELQDACNNASALLENNDVDDSLLRQVFDQLTACQMYVLPNSNGAIEPNNNMLNVLMLACQVNEDDRLKFTAPQDGTLLNKMRQFGNIESGPCAKNSSVVGDSYKKAIRERQTVIYVQLRDACGDLLASAIAATQPTSQALLPQQVPHSHLEQAMPTSDVRAFVISPDGTPLEVGMTPRENGIVAISYFPTIEGSYTLNVLIKGTPINGCPTTMEVRRGRNYDEIAAKGPILTFGKEGSGDGELCRPWGICVDKRGRVLVADRSNNRIQIFDKDGNFLAKFGTSGNRPGQFDRPAGITTNSLNNVIVADKDNHRIQVFDENGMFLLKFGDRGRAVGYFNYPWGVATNSHNAIAVSDTRNHRVQIFTPQGQFVRKCGFDSAYFFKNLDSPRGLCYLPDGQLLITDFNNHRLAVLSPRNMSEMKVYGSEGEADGMFVRPQGVVIDPEGHILVCDSRNNRIQVFSSEDMRFIASFGLGPATSGFQMPTELPAPYSSLSGPFGAPGFSSTPTPLTPSPRQLLDRPTDLAVGPDGRIYVVDFGNNCIRVF